MVTEPTVQAQSKNQAVLRKYPPLIFLVIVLLIAALVLPSALNLPQANPTTVLEYAPVPPEDESPPSAEGNVSSLGLGTSSGLTTGAPPSVPKVDPQKKGGSGKKPVTKRCVGKPLRQTEDPNSPPCVPFFEGDNGGATWQGVTADEIIVLVYIDAYMRTDGESSPFREYCDIDKAPNSDPGCRDNFTGNGQGVEDIDPVKGIRALSKYFNERFQTYDRKVHFWMYFSGASSAAARRADASANWEKLKPFAVLDNAVFGGFNEAYQDAVIRRRTNVYGSFVGLANSYYRKFAPQMWSFWPDLEHAVDMYVTYVCTKVAGFPVAHSDIAGANGKARVFALMSSNDPDFPGLAYYAELAELGIRNCPNGAKLDIKEEVTYSRNQYSTDAHPDAPQEARDNIAKMRGAGITTILWLQGYETAHSVAAKNEEWYPEWVFAGDQLNDAINTARDQQQDVWAHAWGISNFQNEANPNEKPCVQAFREADPSYDATVGNASFDSCNYYRNIFQVFKSIQLAGPHLSPETVDQGHHAIPRYKSTDPRVAACYYDPGDYTCVKDANEIWWDSNAPDPEAEADEKGCYRMVFNGTRFQAGQWTAGDDVFKNRSDPCNTVEAQGFLGTVLDE